MATSPVGSTPSTTNTTNSSSTQNSTAANAFGSLNINDFINLMVTGLQNQDPTNPTDTTTLMQQVSEIGSIESTQNLSTTLQSVALGQSVATAGNLIGRNVTGLDSTGKSVTGVVSSVSVSNGNTTLNVGSSAIPLANVTTIQAASTSS
jgi:flagellar basal-body rod modification protein FlgD